MDLLLDVDRFIRVGGISHGERGAHGEEFSGDFHDQASGGLRFVMIGSLGN